MPVSVKIIYKDLIRKYGKVVHSFLINIPEKRARPSSHILNYIVYKYLSL